ncbi:CD364 [Mytilus edulis]|uniref:PI16 n=1 Tax=Mytilus edulis TaxID=6550 RepID=A0A8S3SSR3_MYTED|nr:CD364 [Mytilus edulis]
MKGDLCFVVYIDRWSRKLQNDAQAWAGKCRYAHAYGKWGENVFKAESFLPDDVLIERAISEWYFEKMSWKFTPDCSEACHYTQVVWAESEEIGCAFKRCTTLFLAEEFIPNGWMLVCYYNPQGNIIGQMPYTHGKPCGACKPGYSCSRTLCGKGAAVKRYMPHNNRRPVPPHHARPKPTPRGHRAPPPPTQLRHTSHSARPHANRHKSGPNAQPPPGYRYQPAANQPPRPAANQPPRPAAHPPRQSTQPGRQPAHSPRQQLHPPRQPHNPGAPVGQYQPQPYPSNKRAHPPQPQATAQVQYISGKVLTGWMPVKTPPRSNNNQTSFPPTPVLSGNTIIKSVKPVPTKPRQEQNPYSGGRSAPSTQINGVQQYPQPSPVQHQQQYSVQQPKQQQQPQIQHQPKPVFKQQTHFKYQQPKSQPPVSVNTRQHSVHQAPQQQKPQQQILQPVPQSYRQPQQQSQHVPNQQPQQNYQSAPQPYIQQQQSQQVPVPQHQQAVQSAPQPYIQPQQSHQVPVPQHQQAVQSVPQPYRQTQQSPQGGHHQYRPQPNTNQRPTNQNPAYAPQQYQNPYPVNTSSQIPHNQQGSVQPYHQNGYQAQDQQYPQYQKQWSPPQAPAPVPAYHQHQEQRRPQPAPQPAHVFVDPRPIYVPPAPVPLTTTTPVPPPPTCYDQDKNCKHWGVYCTSNPYVHDHCRMTCSTCTIPIPPIAPEKVIHTTASQTTTPQSSLVPSNPPSTITVRTDNQRNPNRHSPRRTPPRQCTIHILQQQQHIIHKQQGLTSNKQQLIYLDKVHKVFLDSDYVQTSINDANNGLNIVE